MKWHNSIFTYIPYLLSLPEAPAPSHSSRSLRSSELTSVCYAAGSHFSPVQLSSVTQSCLTLCDPRNRSMPGLPVHHQLPESTQPCPLSRWCNPTISSSVIPFSSCPHSFPLAIYFTHGSVYTWVPISQFVPPSPSPPVYTCPFSVSGSLFLPWIEVHLHHISRWHIYVFINDTFFFFYFWLTSLSLTDSRYILCGIVRKWETRRGSGPGTETMFSVVCMDLRCLCNIEVRFIMEN